MKIEKKAIKKAIENIKKENEKIQSAIDSQGKTFYRVNMIKRNLKYINGFLFDLVSLDR